jgi:hypothetical protein
MSSPRVQGRGNLNAEAMAMGARSTAASRAAQIRAERAARISAREAQVHALLVDYFTAADAAVEAMDTARRRCMEIMTSARGEVTECRTEAARALIGLRDLGEPQTDISDATGLNADELRELLTLGTRVQNTASISAEFPPERASVGSAGGEPAGEGDAGPGDRDGLPLTDGIGGNPSGSEVMAGFCGRDQESEESMASADHGRHLTDDDIEQPDLLPRVISLDGGHWQDTRHLSRLGTDGGRTDGSRSLDLTGGSGRSGAGEAGASEYSASRSGYGWQDWTRRS